MQSQAVTVTIGSTSCADSSSPAAGMEVAPPRTPPDQASIQTSMDKNKETLKRKLMLRRSVNELVDRGIYPPLKTPPALAQKTKQLERAKTGDLLRHKIQQRPDRQVLVQQHILEDTTIDPSLHERQRLLKRSRLVDGLNGKLAHRPGPLELVQGNILQPSLELANAIKDGTIQFVPTCNTEDMDQSSSSFIFDDETTGSDGATSPSMDESSGLSDVSSPSSAPPVLSAESFPIPFTFTKGIPLTINKVPHIPLVSTNASIVATSSSTPKLSTSHPGTSTGAHTIPSSNNNSSGKSRSKKPKPKVMSKGRIIKFHEYKGPPSVVKNQPSSTATVPPSINPVEDTPYHILLQQQQLFLQWQLEFQQNQQQGSAGSAVATASENASVLPAVSSVVATSPIMMATSPTQVQPAVVGSNSMVQAVTLHQPLTSNPTLVTQTSFNPESILPATRTATLQACPAPPAPPPPPPRPTQPVAPRQSTKALTSIPASALSLPKLTGNLEEMKVADLKAELKKRSLPVSGPKPQLIERLKPFTESSSSSSVAASSINSKFSPSRTPSHVPPTALQLGQTTFHIKTEPNGDVTASPVMQPFPSTPATSVLSSTPNGANNLTSIFSVPVTLPVITHGIKTVVSVKPMIKEEPVTSTDISPPNSPHSFQAATSGPTTPMSPDYDACSPSSLIPKLNPQGLNISQGHLNPISGQSLQSNSNSVTHGQTVVSMNIDTSRPASVVPAEMMPMEVDAVSIDLNQGVDDMAFKAASMGHNLDPANFKALIQHPTCAAGFKAFGLGQRVMEGNLIKMESIDTSVIDANAYKTISLSPNFDSAAAIRGVNISPNADLSTIKTINLDSNSQASLFKIPNLSPNADSAGHKTSSVSPVRSTTASMLKAVKVPHLSTQVSPAHLTSPATQTLTSPTSLLQLQQLQTLQQLQQQLLQQSQLHQHQIQQQGLPRQQTPATAFHLTSSNDQVVLAQAKQIEELQRQLQESHLNLKLQQLQQQQMQLQQHQQQQQQQLWQVQIPANFTQNSLLAKLPREQLTVMPQNSQVVTASLQMQQEQPTQELLQPASSVVQQQPGAVSLSSPAAPQASVGASSIQQGQVQLQQQQTPVVASSQNVVCSTGNISGSGVAVSSSVDSKSSVADITGGTSNQLPGSTGRQASVSPYALHINLMTSSGHGKPLPQLQPITTSALAAASAKSPTFLPLQLPAKLLLASANILTTKTVKSEPSTPLTLGPPSSQPMLKSQVTSGQPFVYTAVPSTTMLIPGHTNGVISRTSSLPSSSMVTDQQKTNVQRCSSSPYFSGPLKEPPGYDEAIKIKQQLTNSSVNTNDSSNKILASSNNCSRSLNLGQIGADIKSQAMDDVLEILIRNGDLPPSAATEPLPTPKLPEVMILAQTSPACSTSPAGLSATPPVSSVLVSAQSLSITSPSAVPSVIASIRNISNSLQESQYQHHQPRAFCTSPKDQTLTSVHTNMFAETLLNDTHSLSPQSNLDTSMSSALNLNDGVSHTDGRGLVDWEEMLPSPDLCSMDWSTESGFGQLDLGDSSVTTDSRIDDNIYLSQGQNSNEVRFRCGSGDARSSLHWHSDNSNNNIIQGPEPDLAVLGLGGDSYEAVDPAAQMDMSEWLDVIMPNPSVGNLDMNAPSGLPFSADSVLTPRTQQEVFDIFNFDDPDFCPSVMS